MKYQQVLLSCELRVQGLNILQHLIDTRLAFGGPVLNGPAKFLWKSEVVEHDYAFIVTTRAKTSKISWSRKPSGSQSRMSA